MHLAKGLEFKMAVVMACDEQFLPLKERIEAVADEVELDDVYATERHLLYVACTRARDRLFLTGIKPGSEFISDLATSGDALISSASLAVCYLVNSCILPIWSGPIQLHHPFKINARPHSCELLARTAKSRVLLLPGRGHLNIGMA